MVPQLRIEPTGLTKCWVVYSSTHEDHRGAFSRLFCDTELSDIMQDRRIMQINQSTTKHVGAVRGLHYQKYPAAEMKLVRCVSGRVWDVAVDLRKDSSTYLHFHTVELAPDKKNMFVIPEGFAHGFQVLEPNSQLIYLHTAPYAPEHEGGVLFNDPAINIPWPLVPQDLSARDCGYAPIDEYFEGIKYELPPLQ